MSRAGGAGQIPRLSNVRTLEAAAIGRLDDDVIDIDADAAPVAASTWFQPHASLYHLSATFQAFEYNRDSVKLGG